MNILYTKYSGRKNVHINIGSEVTKVTENIKIKEKTVLIEAGHEMKNT